MTELAPRQAYLERLTVGTLSYQRCGDCSAAVFYPRVTCTACGSTRLEWAASGGRGTVYSTSAIARRDADPYNVTLVDLDEGFRMMSTVVGVPADEVLIGMRVRARVEPAGPDGEPRPVFEPAREAPDA